MRYLLLSFCLFACGLNAHILPWSKTVPVELKQQFLHDGQIAMETPCDYKATLHSLFAPVVQNCKSAREAVLAVAANMTKVTGVYYSQERRSAIMNAQEALAEKKVSCTGQSLLLVSALRSVGIPARLVGVGTWNHVPGNHTWCEAWFDGAWHMIEFNERDFNTPWVMESVAMLDPRMPEQRIYAINGSGKKKLFPFYQINGATLAVEDVTSRYMQLSQIYIGSPHIQRLMVDVLPRQNKRRYAELLSRDGKVLDRAELPQCDDDMRQFAVLELPRKGEFKLKLPGLSQAIDVHATEPPAQVLRFSEDSKAIFRH